MREVGNRKYFVARGELKSNGEWRVFYYIVNWSSFSAVVGYYGMDIAVDCVSNVSTVVDV